MTYANPTERAALISGLHSLAEYLESNPEIPVSPSARVYAFPPKTGVTEMRAGIDIIAARLGVTACESPYRRHYVASRWFEAVEYSAVAIPGNDDESE
jgi:hypothetical protein